MSPPARDAYQTRVRPAHGLVALGAAALAFGYPFALDAAEARLGLAGSAAILCFAALASALAPLEGLRGPLRLGRGPALAIAALAAAAALLRSPVALRLVASVVHGTIALVFARSLSGDDSLIERAARFMQPAAPEFIRPYCRKLTALLAGYFAASAALLGIAAVWLPDAWRPAAGSGVWLLLAALLVLEFLFRKAHFRYYWYGGPFDRLWSRWFPAEDTALGRRSAAYIAEMRARLAGSPAEDAAQGASRRHGPRHR